MIDSYRSLQLIIIFSWVIVSTSHKWAHITRFRDLSLSFGLRNTLPLRGICGFQIGNMQLKFFLSLHVSIFSGYIQCLVQLNRTGYFVLMYEQNTHITWYIFQQPYLKSIGNAFLVPVYMQHGLGPIKSDVTPGRKLAEEKKKKTPQNNSLAEDGERKSQSKLSRHLYARDEIYKITVRGLDCGEEASTWITRFLGKPYRILTIPATSPARTQRDTPARQWTRNLKPHPVRTPVTLLSHMQFADWNGDVAVIVQRIN